MNSERPHQMTVAEQAAEWMLVLKTAGPEETAAFERWLRASPLHVHEMLVASRVQRVWRSVDPERRIDVNQLIARSREQSNVLPLSARLAGPEAPAPSQTPPHARTRGHWYAAMAAGLALFGLLGLMAWLSSPKDAGVYATAIGEQRNFKLQDGSVVFLNTDTRLHVQYRADSRDIYLDRGQALFQVQHDTLRPFRVHAASAVVQAVGTLFDVRLDANQMRVTVVEGKVRVESDDDENLEQRPTIGPRADPSRAHTDLIAGEGAVVDAAGRIEQEATVNAGEVTAWRMQRIIFRGTPLVAIAQEFNRYNAAPHIQVVGDLLKTRTLDGSWDAMRPESFIAYLVTTQALVIERQGNDVIVRERPPIASGT